MVSHKQVSMRHSVEMAVLSQKAHVKGKDLLNMYPQYSRATIYRHARKSLSADFTDKRKSNKGRPKKINIQHERRILRAVKRLRETDGTFTSPRIALEAGLTTICSNRTVRRVLHKAGYSYLQSRKKGLLSREDLQNRINFCKKIKKHKLDEDFWRNNISFYLDGKGFEWKQNPQDQARAPKAREWRKRGEGLDYGCTARGKKEGQTNLNFMVAIAYDHGVVICEQYYGSITGEKFANIVKKTFPAAFEITNQKSKRFLMDGCPRQNSKVAREAIDDVNALIFRIPSRSPDLNIIENFFHLVSNDLKKQAITQNITSESKEQYSQRIIETMQNFNKKTINNLIDSMKKRIDMVLTSNGNRIRY